jgi:hypothetical protein
MRFGLQKICCAALALAMLAFLVPSARGAETGGVAGTYANEKVTLTLRAAGADYTGSITVEGKPYPCTGRLDAAGIFQGTFEINGARFPITLQPAADGTHLLTSGGSKHILKARAAALPAFIQPGLRLSWASGGSTREGCTFEPDPNGYVFKNGHRYHIVEHAGKGQDGIRQLTLQQADAEALIGEVRNFSISANLQGKTIAHAEYDVAVGAAGALVEYWLDPAELARLPQGREADGQVTWRGKFVAGGKEFNSISIARSNAMGSSSLTYDLATGVLLSLLRSDVTPELVVASPDGTLRFNGVVHINRLTFIGARQIKFAWGGEPAPAWAQKGGALKLAGGYRLDVNDMPGMPQVPGMPGFPVAVAFDFRVGTRQVAIGGWHTVQNVDRGGINVEASGVRCFGSHTYVGGLWAAPRALQAMQPNQVLDEDALTGYRTIFAGVRNNLAIIAETGPNEMTEMGYDVRSGSLLMIRNTQRLLPGSSKVTELQVAPR